MSSFQAAFRALMLICAGLALYSSVIARFTIKKQI